VRKIGRVKVFLILLAALFIQLTILNYATIFGAKPDIILICVTFFGLFMGSWAGLEVGLVSGALTDIFSLNFMGMNMFVYGMVGLVSGALKGGFVKESKRIQALLVFLCSVFSLFLHFALTSLFSRGIVLSLYEYIGSCVLPVSIYTSIVSIPIFIKFMEIFGLRQSGEYI
jgi:rod shape-determining protein MreD